MITNLLKSRTYLMSDGRWLYSNLNQSAQIQGEIIPKPNIQSMKTMNNMLKLFSYS